MAGFEQLKKSFFDKAAVLRAVDAGTRKALSKFGAFVRRDAKSSVRKRKATAEPGSPPSSHTAKLKNLVFFSYDADQKSVVTGPLAFGTGTVPRLLEEGGTNAKGRFYRPFPFMKPAFDRTKSKLATIFTDCIKG